MDFPLPSFRDHTAIHILLLRPPPSSYTAMGPVVPGSEVVIGYQALDCLLSVIAGLEALSEAVHTVEPVNTDNDGKSNYEGKGAECVETVVMQGEGGRGGLAGPAGWSTRSAHIRAPGKRRHRLTCHNAPGCCPWVLPLGAARLKTSLSFPLPSPPIPLGDAHLPTTPAKLATSSSVGSQTGSLGGGSLLLPSSGSAAVTMAASIAAAGVQRDVLANMLDALWRPVLPALSSLLVRCAPSVAGGGGGGGVSPADALCGALLRAYQQYIYAAGAVQCTYMRYIYVHVLFTVVRYWCQAT